VTKKTLQKYKRIIDEWFVNGFNGTQAYKKYYKHVKDQTATVNFSKIQSLPELKSHLKKKHDAAARIVNVTHEGILNELKNWIEADITETINLSPEELKELPIELKRLIARYKTTTRDIYGGDEQVIETITTVQLQFVSKERAIDMISKHLGFYEIDNEQKSNDIHIYTSNPKHKGLIEDIIEGKK